VFFFARMLNYHDDDDDDDDVCRCSALHHNNCMYVAHHLITIDKVFQQRLSAADGVAGPRPSSVAASTALGVLRGGPRRPHPSGGGGGVDDGKLMDVVAWVKRLGNDSFTQHVNLKKQQLSDHLRTAKGCLITDKSDGEFMIAGLIVAKFVAICGSTAAVSSTEVND